MMDEKEFDHKGFMADPNKWPHWPILPVKQRVGMALPKLGIMRDTGGILEKTGRVEPVVWLTNLWEVGAGKPWDSIEKIEFGSFDELIEAGWVVD